MRILIIEGVTGAGKSETLRALGRQPAFAARLGPGRVIFDDWKGGGKHPDPTDNERYGRRVRRATRQPRI